jgi:hypothetical protein
LPGVFKKIYFPAANFVTLQRMLKTGHHILLIALLLLLGILPVQAWSVPVATSADSHCMMHKDSVVSMSELPARDNVADCGHCQDTGCDSSECSMPSCLMHQGQVFSVFFNGLSTSGGVGRAVPRQPEVKVRTRNDPPLIRPPIALYS